MLILAVDQGTHATRALLFDEDGRLKASSFVEVSLWRHAPEIVEQDAEEIARSVEQVIRGVLPDSAAGGERISAGIATQRSSVVAWDRETGIPLAPMLSWQDLRAARQLGDLKQYEDKIKETTGLPLSPHYGASKLRWLLDHVPEVTQAQEEGRLALGPLASFLLSRLLDGDTFVVDHANASRTQLWDISRRDWSPWLLEVFGIPRETLPECKPISWEYGTIDGTEIKVTAVNGDQNAAVYALGRPSPGTAIVNLGTGAFILVPTGGDLIQHPRLLSSIIGSGPDWSEYTIEGTVNGAGAAISWARERWDIPDVVQNLPKWFEREQNPPVFINTVGGLGSPWWRSGPEPTLVGDGTRAQIAVAVAESVLFMLRANLDELRDIGVSVERIRVGGGLSQLDGLCQRLADLTGLPVHRPPEVEATGRGVAWLAAGCPENWPDPGAGDVFAPRANTSLQARYETFLKHVGPPG